MRKIVKIFIGPEGKEQEDTPIYEETFYDKLCFKDSFQLLKTNASMAADEVKKIFDNHGLKDELILEYIIKNGGMDVFSSLGEREILGLFKTEGTAH